MTIGQNIKNRRLQLGLSQKELAERIRVAQTTVGAWETERNVPRLPMLARIAEALNTTVGALQGETRRTERLLLRGFIGDRGRATVLGDDVTKPVEIALDLAECEALEVRAPTPCHGVGDILLIGRLSHSPARLIGKECLVVLDGGETVIARPYHGTSKDLFTIVTVAGDILLDQKVKACRPIVGIRRNLQDIFNSVDAPS